MSTFAEKLRSARRAADITQEELAERVGVSPQAVSGWERGLATPGFRKVPAIAHALRQPASLFVEDAPARKAPMTDDEGIEVAVSDLPEDWQPLTDGRQFWRLTTANLAGVGLLPGDYLALEPGAEPESRNIVLAEIGGALVFRVYWPPNLHPMPSAGAPHPGTNQYPSVGVSILGVVRGHHRNP